MAASALTFGIVWEWRHRDPVVEIALLRDRNFALANVFYFIFGFTLFASTVTIPEMLQSLYGYTATDAGLVLGPGAAVITLLAPVVVWIFPKTGAARLIGFACAVVALSMWYYGSFTPATDYRHETLARAFQGLGYAFLFVPITELAYSYLPANKNNKASSLTNLSRNWGGSFGIAFATTEPRRRKGDTRCDTQLIIRWPATNRLRQPDGSADAKPSPGSSYSEPRSFCRLPGPAGWPWRRRRKTLSNLPIWRQSCEA